MSRWGCPACGVRYALQLFAGCPRCPDTQLVEENSMPKITVHGGPTGHLDPQDEGSEQPSPGTSSSTSKPTPDSKSQPNEAEDPSPAPTTANRSSRRRTGRAGSADSTDTSGPGTDGEA